jgi:hypothetical protein
MSRQRPLDAELAWALVFRLGPISAQSLCAMGRFGLPEVTSVLDELVRSGRVQRDAFGLETIYKTQSFIVPVGSPSGWEGAVFDHFHAVVRTIGTKLQRAAGSSPADEIGGSTYSYEIWQGHPLADEVLGTLRRFRSTMCVEHRCVTTDLDASAPTHDQSCHSCTKDLDPTFSLDCYCQTHECDRELSDALANSAWDYVTWGCNTVVVARRYGAGDGSMAVYDLPTRRLIGAQNWSDVSGPGCRLPSDDSEGHAVGEERLPEPYEGLDCRDQHSCNLPSYDGMNPAEPKGLHPCNMEYVVNGIHDS